MAVDLHLHSVASDGTEAPAAVVARAVRAGLTAIALTDHDTLDGIPAAMDAASSLGIRLISGTELSVEWPTGTMHLLVYHLAPEPGPLQDRLGGLRDGRHVRNRRILQALSAAGIDIPYEEVVAEALGGAVGRPHIAARLVARGHVAEIAEAFDRYLARGRPAYVDRIRLDAFEAVELARESGALPVVAHPHTLGVSRTEYATAFTRLAEHGLVGIEAWYSEYEPDVRRHLAHLADRLGLVATGGSDYHGRYKPGIEIGRGRGDLDVPDSAAADLDAALGV